jgi:hypothetical protein
MMAYTLPAEERIGQPDPTEELPGDLPRWSAQRPGATRVTHALTMKYYF